MKVYGIQAKVDQHIKTNQKNLLLSVEGVKKLSIDFKVPLPLSTHNIYVSVVVDKFFRFPFCFARQNISLQAVYCLDRLFTLCGTLQGNASSLFQGNAHQWRCYPLDLVDKSRGGKM